jgi:hypothetical protein
MFDSIPIDEVIFLLISFTPTLEEVSNHLCNSRHGRFWSKEEGGLVDWKRGHDQFYEGEFSSVGEPLSTPSYDFGLEFAYYLNPQ